VLLPSTAVSFSRGSAENETAWRETVWNRLLPYRFPDVIVQARDVQDVIDAVQYAKEHGQQIGVRSGGHSWAAVPPLDERRHVHLTPQDCHVDETHNAYGVNN
jgi:hypothetical protein